MDRYQILIEGQSACPSLCQNFEGAHLSITHKGTLIDIRLRDQSELLGLLRQLRDKGLILNQLTRIISSTTAANEQKKQRSEHKRK